MSLVRVLVVDDSAVFRSQIHAALGSLGGFTVIGTAPNGKVALEKLEQLPVDLITLDLEMPEMTGLEMLKIMKSKGMSQRVIVFSSVSKSGAEITLEALSLGAYDFVTKPSTQDSIDQQNVSPTDRIKNALAPKLKALFPENNPTPVNLSREPGSSTPQNEYPPIIWEAFFPKVVVIGSSTGGPTALEKIFSEIRGPIKCPILITQHMPPVFTAMLAERLEKASGIKAAEAIHGEILQNDRVYIAPGNYHMRLSKGPNAIKIMLDQEPVINFVRPAVDPLFSSAASIFQNKCFGIVLTGMGEDGKNGTLAIKNQGGAVMIQNKESCVVFGMPGAVFSSNTFDKIGDLNQIRSILQEKIAA